MNNISRTLHLGSNLSRRSILQKNVYQINQSIRNVTSTQKSEVVEMKLTEIISNVEPRIERRKPQVKPFVKELFIGELEKELLAFPEVLNKAEIEAMNQHVKTIESFAAENSTSDDFTTFLKNIKMYGAPATVMHGGLASIITERCKYLETISHDVLAALRIKNHWIGIDCVMKGLNEELANKIIPELVTGNVAINLLAAEKISTDQTLPDINCNARSNVKGEWAINGEKTFYGEMSAGYFVVICNVDHEVLQPFLVYPGAQGVEVNHSSITFKNTPAVLLGRNFGESSIEDIEKSTALLKTAISQNRFGNATIAVGLLRNTITAVIQHTRNKFICGSPYSDLQLLQNTIAEAVTVLYASESMIYFTAGLQDGYEKPDTDLEMAVCKIYITKRVFDAINNMILILGLNNLPPKLIKYMDDARILLMADEQIGKINNYVALNGMQHVGKFISVEVGQGRNPFKYPMFTIKRMFKERYQYNDRPQLTLHLNEHLHPSLQETSLLLEYCIMRMKYASEKLLFRHGTKILDEHRSLNRLGSIAAEIYASVASLSRASRAYCIGLHMGENELVVGAHVTWETKKIVSELVTDISNDYIINRDHFRADIADKSLKYGTSHYEHCLERVFF